MVPAKKVWPLVCPPPTTNKIFTLQRVGCQTINALTFLLFSPSTHVRISVTSLSHLKAGIFRFIFIMSSAKRQKMASLLDQLKQHTTVVADTGDFDRKFELSVYVQKWFVIELATNTCPTQQA